VFLDRFAGVENRRPSEEGLIGRLGGDLDGLADRLDHIVAVGANTIWLSPVHPSPAATATTRPT
jgi:glycosidase